MKKISLIFIFLILFFNISFGSGFKSTNSITYMGNDIYLFYNNNNDEVAIVFDQYDPNKPIDVKSDYLNRKTNENYLIQTKCIPTLNNDDNRIDMNFNQDRIITFEDNKYEFKLNKKVVFNDLSQFLGQSEPKILDILKANYYTKTEVKYKIIKDNEEKYQDEIIYYISPEGENIQTEIDELKNKINNNDFGSGTFKIKIDIEPVDLKCDFNEDGSLDYNEIQNLEKELHPEIKVNQKCQVQKITYNGIDYDIEELDHDSNKEIQISNEKIIGGKKTYTLQFKCNDGNIDITENGIDPKCDIGFTKSGFYCLNNNDRDFDDDNDEIINVLDDCPTEPGSLTANGCNNLIIGSGKPKKKGFWYEHFGIFGKTICNEPVKIYLNNKYIETLKKDKVFDSNNKFKNSFIENYQDIAKIGNNNLEVKYKTNGLAGCSFSVEDNENIPFQIIYSKEINLKQNNRNKKVIWYNPIEYNLTFENQKLNITDKNYFYNLNSFGKIENRNINKVEVAVLGHTIYNFRSLENAKNRINKLIENIKNKIFNETRTNENGNTIIKINGNFTENDNFYYFFEKRFLNDINNVELKIDGKLIDNDKNKYFQVIDKDPIIGYNFEDNNSEIIIRIIDNEDSKGIILIEEDKQNFNNGETIFNIRENSCEDYEMKLFYFDDFVYSNISKNKQMDFLMCASHKKVDLKNALNQKILFYENNSKLNFNKNGNSININVPNNYEFDSFIGENNPTNSYSCLGSFDNDFLFGDCDFKPENRIWVAITQEDRIAPKTSIQRRFLTKILGLVFNVDDKNPKTTFYNFNEDNFTLNDKSSFKKIDSTSNKLIQVSCNNESQSEGCITNLHYYSVDENNNTEEVKKEEVFLLDIGSSCQSDCSAIPSPNRILKECRNINSCQFAPIFDINNKSDDGVYVSNICDKRPVGAFVSFNSSYEIKCPNLGFRKKVFTDKKIVLDTSKCDVFIPKKFSVFLDKKIVNLVIGACKVRDTNHYEKVIYIESLEGNLIKIKGENCIGSKNVGCE